MEKDRRARVVAIAALLVGVVGLSLGFAAFTNTLTIKSSAAVTVDDSTFNVDFSKQSASVVDGTLSGTPNPATNGPTAADATIDNSAAGAPQITGLKATFTQPGQKVTYSFYTKNAGALKAYLTNVNFANATGGSANKVCTAKTGTTQSLVDTACQGISLKLTLGSEAFTESKARANFTTATAHDLTKNGEAGDNEAVTVEIEYAEGSGQADGDFDVTFGDITLTYSSVA